MRERGFGPWQCHGLGSMLGEFIVWVALIAGRSRSSRGIVCIVVEQAELIFFVDDGDEILITFRLVSSTDHQVPPTTVSSKG